MRASVHAKAADSFRRQSSRSPNLAAGQGRRLWASTGAARNLAKRSGQQLAWHRVTLAGRRRSEPDK